MLNIACPNCHYEMKLTQFKPGKFAPQCKKCSKQFQLLIKSDGAGGHVARTAPMPAPSPALKPNSSPAAKPVAGNLNETTDSREAKPAPETRIGSSALSQPTPDETAIDSKNAESRSVAANSDNSEFELKPQTPSDRGKPTRPPSAVASGQLGPYRLLKLLGQGGMGAVYLANQTTLDRNVALKVVKENLSGNPSMLARFTREAYAAAQLVHPNVVQIYDMGDDKGSCYFSMELVDGCSLSDLVQKHKKLDPDQAASYILHAAKGLQCAHNAGMVHRDIKPANLLVTSAGLVKVADLGLVKVPDEDEIEGDLDTASALSASPELTGTGTALGTPYYMAPEQALNATTVDHRADIYSLGCTFYVLLTGKRPFDGKSFQEVLSKHSIERLVLPTEIVSRVPVELSAIVGRTMAKKPADRYQSTDDLIADLEQYLGVSNTGTFTPSEADANTLERCLESFNGIALAKVRGLIPFAIGAGSLLLAIVILIVKLGLWPWATGMLLIPLTALAGYFVMSGISRRAELFVKSRELIYRSGIFNWLKWIAGAVLFVIVTALMGTLLPWLLCGAVGIGLGVLYYYAIDVPIRKQRTEALLSMSAMLRKMRLKGMDEPTLQTFVAKYSGDHWEEFFEEQFGYTAKRRMRDELAKSPSAKNRPRFRAWRDRISDALDLRLEPLQSGSERKYLQKVEQANLQAQGVTPAEAKLQAAAMADALVDHGDSIRVAQLEAKLAQLDPEVRRRNQREKVKAMLAEARSGKYARKKSSIVPVLNAWAGSYSRFLLGCVLMLGCLLWARQNGLFSLEQIQQVAATAQSAVENATDSDAATENAQAIGQQLKQSIDQPTAELKLPVVGRLFHNFNPLIAGLILIFSAFIGGWRMTLFAVPAVVVTMWGAALGIPDIEPVESVHSLSALIGIAILMLGIVFGRSGD